MNVAFDTNVFINNGSHYDDLRIMLFGKTPICRIVLDEEGELKKEYMNAFRQYPKAVVLKNFIQRVSEQSGGPNIAILKSRFEDQPDTSSDHLAELANKGCGKQIEPALFGLVHNNPDVYLYLKAGKISRGYATDEGWDFVNRTYLRNQSELWLKLHRAMAYPGHPYPRTKEDLEQLVNEYKRAGRPTEHDLLEFKAGPFDFIQFRDEVCDDSLRERIVKAVCGMLNTRSGWVFVGVNHQDCSIVGFPPVHVKKVDDLQTKEPDSDKVQQLISQNICSIDPKPLSVDKQCVQMWSIDVGNDRIVLSILITKPEGVTFTYKGISYGRLGTTFPR